MEVRQWGTYRILNEDTRCKVKELVIQPHRKTSLQSHKKRSEHWIILNGKLKVVIEKDNLTVEKNQHVYIPTGSKHQIINYTDEPVHLIEVHLGTYFGEDDITRY